MPPSYDYYYSCIVVCVVVVVVVVLNSSNLIFPSPPSIHAIELNYPMQMEVAAIVVPHDDVPRQFALPAWAFDGAMIFWAVIDEVVVAVVVGVMAI